MNEENKTTPYPKEYLEEMGAGLRYTDWILSSFESRLKGHVCEVGAGTGNISTELLKRPIEKLTLLEPDTALFQILTSKISDSPKVKAHHTTHADFNGQFQNPQDAFVYINVLEHIKDDVGELKLMYQNLRLGGTALIFVPALPFLFSQYDREVGHWRRYTKSELTDKINTAGFHLQEIRYFDFVGIFAWLLACKLLKMRPGSNNMSIYDRTVVPVSEKIESVIPPFLGKNLLAIAVKQ